MLPADQLTLIIPPTTKPRVVVVGGGFAGVNLLKNLPGDLFQVVLLSKTNYFGFWPLLYQVATAELEAESIGEPLRQLFEDHADFHFRCVNVSGLDPAAQVVHTPVGDLHYDYLVLATGTATNFFGNQEIEQKSLGLKDIGEAVGLRNHLLQTLEQASLAQDPAERQRLLTFVLAGAGPTGVELAASLAQMRRHTLPQEYPDLDFEQMRIYLVDGLDRVLPPMSDYAGRHAHQYLQELGVSIKLKQLVDSYDGQTVTFKNGETIKAGTLVWAAGVQGATIGGLPPEKIEHSRYLVNGFNMVLGYQNVFAIGDVALMKSPEYPKGHPQVAPPAMQQGTALAANLVRQQRGEPWQPFQYLDKGTLAIVGRGRAVADLPDNVHLGGRLAWFTWLTVHLFYLSGFRNKLLVATNWAYRIFTQQRGSSLIIRPRAPLPSQPAPAELGGAVAG
ncbi:NAD(P)/FAD-dependent oxidoreductase [Hymenobacter sp. RP-2-7]|uniref:NADH:ubiquinone reductase (non-electrogenic) n=1 Tax=Hymenobacter polaris TaxID=2682546 RepID=A0A7Y0FLJ0_9BACT|nr:NAD(P)/FAD-dependent oxidoreductase [Hymenobacter polaris]NML64858.1 NAD(P)/FAD-dependent oxidoreductase [Hymenobacter polaris]